MVRQTCLYSLYLDFEVGLARRSGGALMCKRSRFQFSCDTWTALEELENKNAAVLELKSCGMREICQPAKLKICLSDHLKLWTKKTVAFKWHY